jgi:hypothetical protein
VADGSQTIVIPNTPITPGNRVDIQNTENELVFIIASVELSNFSTGDEQVEFYCDSNPVPTQLIASWKATIPSLSLYTTTTFMVPKGYYWSVKNVGDHDITFVFYTQYKVS